MIAGFIMTAKKLDLEKARARHLLKNGLLLLSSLNEVARQFSLEYLMHLRRPRKCDVQLQNVAHFFGTRSDAAIPY